MSDKLTAIKIKHPNGTLSNQILISALAENVKYDNTRNLVDVLNLLKNKIDQISDPVVSEQARSWQGQVADIRVGYDGTSYQNAGEAVRGQISNLANSIIQADSTLTIPGAAADSKITGDKIDSIDNVLLETRYIFSSEWKELSWHKDGDGAIDSQSPGSIIQSGTFSYTNYILIKGINRIRYKRISSTANISNVGLSFYNENFNWIDGKAGLSQQSSNEYVLDEMIIPENATYVRFTYRSNTNAYGDFNVSGISSLQDNINELKTEITPLVDIPISIETPGCYEMNTSTRVVNSVPSSIDGYKCAKVSCSEGESFTISGQSDGENTRIVVFTDSSYNAIWYATKNITVTDLVLIVPENASWVFFNNYNDSMSVTKNTGVVYRVNNLQAKVDNAIQGFHTDNLVFNAESAVKISNGAITDFSGYTTWASSELIEIPDNTTQLFTNANNGLSFTDKYGYAIFDINRKFKTGGQFPLYKDGVYSSDIPILETYKYIRFTNYNTNSNHNNLYVTFCIGTANKIKYAVDNVDTMKNESQIDIIGTVILDTYISFDKQNRVVYSSLSGSKAAVCDVSKINGRTIYVSSTQVSSTYKIIYAFVNSNGVIIDFYQSAASEPEMIEKKALVIPNEAKTLIINCESEETVSAYTNNINAIEEYPFISLKGSSIVTYGDSLTWYDTHKFTWGDEQDTSCIGFQSHLRTKLGMSTVNRGVSGQTTPQICARILNASDLSSFDYMTIMGGDNDDRLDVSVGTVQPIGETFDTSTVCGALQSAIEYALGVNPELRIILMTEPMGWTYRSDRLVRVSELIPNAYINVAKLYGLPLINLWSNSGINELTRSTYYLDPSIDNVNYMYHPNNAGWERLSRIICQGFKSL